MQQRFKRAASMQLFAGAAALRISISASAPPPLATVIAGLRAPIAFRIEFCGGHMLIYKVPEISARSAVNGSLLAHGGTVPIRPRA